ncbi:MAG: aspartate-semialdehyde dehydrogenase [candidate division Zixibacteria bacterium]|nr:aspartate-semialdehyde dehydrogenase [candidate division Zixibacteria bacterium]
MHSFSSDKIPVAVLGATGIVGQAFCLLLADHPVFELACLTGSDSRANQIFSRDINWHLPLAMPDYLKDLPLSCFSMDELSRKNIKIVFCALPTDVAKEIEPKLRDSGYFVFSNAGVNRLSLEVPLIIPEINASSISLIGKQGFPQNGFVVCNSNCAVSGLALAVAPLIKFGIKKVIVATYQSLSGAGYPGVASLDALGNIIPFIPGEEDKIGVELSKIIGHEIPVSATCVRVPVLFGHTEAVWIECEQRPSEKDIIRSWNEFSYNDASLKTLPDKPLTYHENSNYPQPRTAFHGNPFGMTVEIGRLQTTPDGFKFVLMVNNLIRGAAGGSVANAELFVSRYGECL